MTKGRASGGGGGRPSAADLAQRKVLAQRIRPLVGARKHRWVYTNPAGEEAYGPLHRLHVWRPGDISIRTLQGEAWFNSRRRMMQGFRDQFEAMQGMLTLGQPLGELDQAIHLLCAAWRAADQARPAPVNGMPFVAVQLADEKTVEWRQEENGKSVKVESWVYASWKDAEPVAMRRLGIDVARDRHALAEADPMRTAEALRKAAQRSR